MEWYPLIGPAVVAALVSGVISVVGFIVSSRTARGIHQEKLAFDDKLAERKFDFDKQLAERKFALDARLADRKRHQDLAEEVLVGFYEVHDLMMAVRSPGGYESEGKSRKRDPGENEDVAREKDTYFAILERFDARREPVAKLMSRQYRMVAWFGEEAAVPFKTLHEAIVNVTVSAQMLVRCAGDGGRRANTTSWTKWEEAIWWGLGDPDPVATKIDKAIEDIERVCRPILKGDL